ncbi:MAG: sigma-54 dependent transcriptional regulator [Chlorobium sp.]|uniref:sigma-54 interaction domain-containing protein n=1 Tax=Chlorobium sp. TaxID=1095 RepID=UPI0025BA8104|nr:sigma-54 dependent transcriptional regulator [Chlorobium sp.]MCF8382663.1 sigma-54 dependent transcriptional regulator [Chlorobium sp.]
MKAAREQRDLIGNSTLITRLRELASQVAETDITVLISGETGSGKEVLARFIHEHSRRRAKNFIPVNCGAIPSGLLESELFGHEKGSFTGAIQARKGYFESADQGTIFLDEIGEMPPETQVKFLRVLESGEFQRVGSSETIYSDARVIAATNKNLYQQVAENNFREDLYYRLRSVELQLPPLRERGRDILLLTEHFVRESERQHGITFEGFDPEAVEVMLRYPWPGNIRELRNLIDSLLVLEKGKKITPEILEKHLLQRSRHKGLVHDPSQSEKQELNLIYSSIIQLRQEMSEIRHLLQMLLHNRTQQPALLLPPPVAQTASTPEPDENGSVATPQREQASETGTSPSLEEIEKKTILETLQQQHGNRRQTARVLGINERTLYRKIKAYGIG